MSPHTDGTQTKLSSGVKFGSLEEGGRVREGGKRQTQQQTDRQRRKHKDKPDVRIRDGEEKGCN